MRKIEEPWILAGHKIFAEKGPEALKVEVLAREVNKNKSSFYHHFADLQVFRTRLLEYHRKRALILLESVSLQQTLLLTLWMILSES